MPSGIRSGYPVLAAGCCLRLLEVPYIFNAAMDQLYEIDREALEFLLRCEGADSLNDLVSHYNNPEIMELIDYMTAEDIIEFHDRPLHRKLKVSQSPIPSLRYLLLHITTRCNLKCKHCYLGKSTGGDLGFDMFERVVDEFRQMGGLKIMLSGGEPLLHPLIWKFLEYLRSSILRVVILSNGTLIDENTAFRLAGLVHEVQVSIDGTASHDALRGEGTLDKTLAAVDHMKAAGIDVSVASMIHARNLGEFEEMEELFSEMELLQWSVDLPCETGYLAENPEWTADLSRAARIFSRYGFGAGAHESTGHYTCGTHLCTVMPNGNIARCGFFEDDPAGSIKNGLAPAWQRLKETYLWDLDELDCARCTVIQECHGGCRYRAKQWGGSMFSPDPLLCLANDVDPFTYVNGLYKSGSRKNNV